MYPEESPLTETDGEFNNEATDPINDESTMEESPHVFEAANLPIMTTHPIEREDPTPQTLIKKPLRGDGWKFDIPSRELQLRIQEDLFTLGLYNGKMNGKWGDLSVHAISKAVGSPVTVPSYELIESIQKFAGFDVIDGYLDYEAWERFASKLEGAEE